MVPLFLSLPPTSAFPSLGETFLLLVSCEVQAVPSYTIPLIFSSLSICFVLFLYTQQDTIWENARCALTVSVLHSYSLDKISVPRPNSPPAH